MLHPWHGVGRGAAATLSKNPAALFEDYKVLENKEVRIEKFLGPDETRRIIREAFDLYEQFKTTLTGGE